MNYKKVFYEIHKELLDWDRLLLAELNYMHKNRRMYTFDEMNRLRDRRETIGRIIEIMFEHEYKNYIKRK